MGTLPKVTAYALPGVLAEMARIAGTDIAIAIAREYGGRRLYLPRAPKRDHPLCKLIGTRPARLICEKLTSAAKGDYFQIPSARTYLHWYDARRLRTEGKSHTQISRAIGISTKQVALLLKGFEAPPATAAAAPEEPKMCPVCHRRHRLQVPHQAGDARQLRLL
jgi:hypothetical protein